MPIGSVFGAFFSLYIPHHNHIQNIYEKLDATNSIEEKRTEYRTG